VAATRACWCGDRSAYCECNQDHFRCQQRQIILPIGREQHLLKVIASLEMLECNRERTSLLALVDGEADGAVFFLPDEAPRQIAEVTAAALKQALGS
jgi:hypothetical protein